MTDVTFASLSDKRKRIIPQQSNNKTPSSSTRKPRPKLPTSQPRDTDSANLVDNIFTSNNSKESSRNNKDSTDLIKESKSPQVTIEISAANKTNSSQKPKEPSKETKAKNGVTDEAKSETGTYTIDSPSEEVELARKNIDAVFGVDDSGTAYFHFLFRTFEKQSFIFIMPDNTISSDQVISDLYQMTR